MTLLLLFTLLTPLTVFMVLKSDDWNFNKTQMYESGFIFIIFENDSKDVNYYLFIRLNKKPVFIVIYQ